MSENQNRDFAKYDTMETEELEEILRSDSQSPEGQESDGELLLYVMGVLAHRKRNSDNPGKTAQEAWESFEKHYLLEEEEADTTQSESKKARPGLRRWIAAVAAAAFIVAIPLTASALSWDEIWNAVATWAKNTFSFTSQGQPDPTEPSQQDKLEYNSLQKSLIEADQDPDIVPAYIPDGYELLDISVEETPVRKMYIALYSNAERILMITVQSYIDSDPEKIEINENLIESYKKLGTTYYIFSNMDQLRAVWINGSYECNISGNITMDEIKLMIDSIVKG